MIPTGFRKCLACEAPFRPRTPNHLYCSNMCKLAHDLKKKRKSKIVTAISGDSKPRP